MPEMAPVLERAPTPPELPTREELFAKYEGQRRAQVDRYGVPYIIRQYDVTDLSIAGFRDESLKEDDEDHSFYCHDAPELLRRFSGVGGLALRVSRAQTSNRLLHALKHAAHPGGLAEYPDTPDKQFSVLVLIGGGYFSRQAWDYKNPDRPHLVTMSKREYEDIIRRKALHTVYHSDRYTDVKTVNYSRAIIGIFFAEYARSQQFDFLDENIIDCFIHTTNQKKRERVGAQIINEAITQLGDRVNPVYAEAFKDQGAEPHPRLASAGDVVRSFFYRRRWFQYYDAFEEALRKQHGLTPRAREGIIIPVNN